MAAALALKEPPLEIPAGIELEHLAVTIGTVVHGIDLREPLTPSTANYLKALMLERQVLFFRDQDLTVEQHMTVCRNWGELEIIPFLPQLPGQPEVLHIKRDADNKPYENVWHSDVTWRTEPSFGSMLRAIEVPALGGDTLFCDMYAAYDGLPSHLKRACEGLQAVHSITVGLGLFTPPDVLYEQSKKFPPATHPVIRTHPETGRKLIYVNRAHTQYIKGMRRDDSNTLLEQLYSRANTPEYQCRFKWQKNSIAFWDNRACQHYAAADYFPQNREMYRVTIVGDKPF